MLSSLGQFRKKEKKKEEAWCAHNFFFFFFFPHCFFFFFSWRAGNLLSRLKSIQRESKQLEQNRPEVPAPLGLHHH